MNTSFDTDLGDGPFAVTTTDLTKSYGGAPALDGLSLQVPQEAVYVLAGPNGAGKSTLLNVLLDLVRPDGGSAEVLGLDPRRDGPDVRARIGYVPETSNWPYRGMTVSRLLAHHGVFHPSWDEEYARNLAASFDLRLDRRFGELSKGQARHVELTMALAHRPPILLLDEPTDGLDPMMRDETLGLLADHIAASPTTALISTHHVHELDRLADHLGVIRDGRLTVQASRATLRRRLRRYRADVPSNWNGVSDLGGAAVVRRKGLGREIQWTIWGEQDRVVAHLTGAGATVRDVSTLALEEAAVALLHPRASS